MTEILEKLQTKIKLHNKFINFKSKFLKNYHGKNNK